MAQPAIALDAKMELLKTEENKRTHTGVQFPRHFTARLEPGKTPYDEVVWETRTASIGNDKGSVIFEQRDVEVPADWSQTATNIVASKYFHGKLGTPERETSVAQLVHRVVDTIADWGKRDGYFLTAEDAENFRNELAHLMLHQKACFNSPVWFNVGVKEARGYGWVWDKATESVIKLVGRDAAAVLGVLHRLGEGFARIHSRPGEDRGHAFQVGVWNGLEPVDAARGGWHSLGRRAGHRVRFRS